MNGGLLCVPIMRPNPCWTLLPVSILAALALTLNADGEDLACFNQIAVPRDTTHEIFLGQDLTIKCPVLTCNSTPAVSWYKLEPYVPVNVSSSSHIKTGWKWTNKSEWTSYLIFHKILGSDSGLYRCQSENDMGHSINVSVHGDSELTAVRRRNNSDGATSNLEAPDKIWMYVYSAAGIGAFVTMVIIITVISMRGCKGKSKKETATENQYMGMAMVEAPFPHGGLQPSPRESPSAPSPRDNGLVYGKVKGHRERTRPAVGEGSSVVYAALNHQLPPGPAPRPLRQRDEFSEYAAIRVS